MTTASTTLNVILSATLQSNLSQAGVWAYAVYFDNNDATPTWTALVTNGVVQGESGQIAITLTEPFTGGKIYFIIQSQDSTQPYNLGKLITQQSDINWSNAAAWDFRYDSFEVTLLNQSSDVGNLTSITGFGLPLGVSAGSASVGYAISADSLVEQIQNINPANTYTFNYQSGPLSGNFRIALSPTEAVGSNIPGFQPSDWAQYVQSLAGSSATDIVLSGLFNGAVDADNVWHNGGYFAYQLQVETTDSGTFFWLVPLPSSQIKGAIRLTVADLENSIYSTLGTANIFRAMEGDSLFMSMNTGWNNQWGKVLSEFLIGFTAGFYNTSGQSLNAQVTTAIDLNQNINWDPVYAFGQNLQTSPPSYQACDPYSQIFYKNSNSYGSSYSDALMSQYVVGGPLLSVYENGADVTEISLTIFADSETPTGYTVPEIYNYLAPGTNGYQAPSGAGAGGQNVALSLAAAVANNAGVVLDGTETITLNILTSDTNDTPAWSTVTFDGSPDVAGEYGLWQIWEISYANGSYSAAPASSPVKQPVGTLLIDSFPVPTTSDTNAICWYQIQIGTKTFNLYTTTNNGQFANPDYANQQGWLAVDGLATISPQGGGDQWIPTFTINFFNGDTVTIDPTVVVPNTANVSNLPPPNCPVAGNIWFGEFKAIVGQDNQVSNTITATDPQIAFAWTGQNNASENTASWISGYTNKIDAETIALITIAPESGDPITVTGKADIDGQWQTGLVNIPAGTYSVTMQEYLPGDTTFSTPMTPQSSVLTLTVVTSS